MTNLWFEAALLPDGWARGVRLRLSGERIAAVETDVAPGAEDAHHGVALPTLPNLHSHAFQRAMAGLGERRGPSADSFWTWREVMYRFAGRIDPDAMQAIAAMAFVEMLESGFGRVGEFHYLHHDPDGRPYDDPAEMGARLAAAADETGIALTLLPVLYRRSGFGGAAAGVGQRRFLHDIDDYARLIAASRKAVAALPDAVVGVAPHSLRAVTPEELDAAVAIGGDGPIHIHIAEQVQEVEDCLAWSGARPVGWLLDHQPVDARWCLVHATHMDADEIAGLARSGAVAGLCPLTEASLGDGIFPGADYCAAGGRLGIGSDSNILIDAGRELAMLEYSQRLRDRGRNILAGAEASTGRSLLAAALNGGAQALGVAPPAIVEGAVADFWTLAFDHVSLAGRRGDDLLDGWIFSAGRAAVDCLWRRGRQWVSGGRHQAREQIAARYRWTVEALLDD